MSRRSIAILIDLLVIFFIFQSGIILGLMYTDFYGRFFGIHMIGLPLAYYLLKDNIFGNKSLGKLIAGLAVVNEDGTKPHWKSLVRRNNPLFLFENTVELLNNKRTITEVQTNTKVVRCNRFNR